jgi:hypothetical protein
MRAVKTCGWTLAVVFSASIAAGQAHSTQTAIVVNNPHYVSLMLEITINRPAAEVWKRVGKFCDVAESFQLPCKIISGKDGEVGAVRFLGSAIGNEILVGKTDLSYTYAQPLKAGQPYDLYHGTVEAKPLTGTTSKLVYTLLYDNSMLANEAARQKDRAERTALFTRGLNNMKSIAETGALPRTAAPPQ